MLCSKEFKHVNHNHLKYRHKGMTISEYQKLFPDIPTLDTQPITHTIVCPNCGKTKTFKKAFKSLYKNKFCNRSCAATYYDKLRWADPNMREKIIEGIKQDHSRPEKKAKIQEMWTPEKRKIASEKAKKLWEDPEYVQKVTCNLSQLAKELWADPTHRAKMLEIFNREAFTEACAQRTLERWADPTYYENTVASMKDAALKRWANPDFYEKMCLIVQERWTDPVWAEQQVQKMMAGQRVLPTKPELELFSLLNSKGYRYVYTGDRGLFIGGKNPDFIWPERRLIVECFGAYWHDEDEIESRTKHFVNYGFETLIIWDYELDNIEQLLVRLKEFHQGAKLIE